MLTSFPTHVVPQTQEYTRRKLALEKSLQHSVRSRHLALNDKYMELMDYVACPWIQSVLPVSLACEDLNFWIARIRYSMPSIRLPARLRELAGLPPQPSDDISFEEFEDGRPTVEPMELKRRAMSTGTTTDGHEDGGESNVSNAFRMVQMSIIMGCKVVRLPDSFQMFQTH